MERRAGADSEGSAGGHIGRNGTEFSNTGGGRGHARRRAPVLIYDGECAFCTAAAELTKRYLTSEVAILPWQYSDLTGQPRAQAEDEVLLLHPDGRRVWGGSDAVAVLLLAGPHRWAWPIGWLLRLPVGRAVGAVLYRWVSKNRHRMPGGVPACQSGSPA